MYRKSKCRIIEKNLFNYETEINKLWWYLEIEGVMQRKLTPFNKKCIIHIKWIYYLQSQVLK